MKLRHICEVCDREEVLTPEVAFEAGWDYPPRLGSYAVISPRTCPNCLMADTVWAALVMQQTPPGQLTDRQRAVVDRILAEPASITVQKPN